jgi:ferritin-like metal-binding protein YciE
MATTKAKSASKTSDNGSSGSKKSGNKSSASSQNGMQSSQLMELFKMELKDIYWVEKALAKAIPKMIKNAASEELREALENHLEETKEQVKRAEQVFEAAGLKATAKKCEAMEGLIAEANEVIEECEPGAMCDAGIIAAAQKVEHYEISAYGTLRQFAETLGLAEAADLLEMSLEEEKTADGKLTEVAVSSVNIEAEQE